MNRPLSTREFGLLFRTIADPPQVSYNQPRCCLASELIESIRHELESNLAVQDILDWITFAAWCLQQCVQANFAGPPLNEKSFSKANVVLELLHSLPDFEKERFASIVLTKDGAVVTEPGVTPLSKHATACEYLAMAKFIFVDTAWKRFGQVHKSVYWWACRTLIVWQRMLDEKSSAIQDKVQSCLREMQYHFATVGQPNFLSNPFTMSRMCTEFVYAHIEYLDVKSGEEFAQKALERCGLGDLNFTGILGVRTRYQADAIAQLAIALPSDVRESASISDVPAQFREDQLLPLDCKLQDDTLLERIKYEATGLPCERKLTPIEQSAVLAFMTVCKRSQAKDVLLNEQLRVFVDKLLDEPQSWCVQAVALYLRCELEADERRKVERAMMQMQELVEQFSRPLPQGHERVEHFYLTGLPTIWNVKKGFADLLQVLGCVREALTIYESLKMYEDMVRCYRLLNKRESAEQLIWDLLAADKFAGRRPDPEILILLGDITGNEEHYVKAWTESDCKSAKAQKNLGFLHYGRKQYDKACEALKLSVELLPLQQDAWFTLGCSALETEQYELACKAFHRCTTIEPDNYEAWNNLSAAHIHLKRKPVAVTTLKEAIKQNFDNWKIWENYLLVSLDCGEFADTILCANRLLDLKGKWVDHEVLRRLLSGLDEQSKLDRFLPTLRKLFGRLTSVRCNDSELFRLYAEVTKPCEAENEFAVWEKYVRLRQKALQCAVAKEHWERPADSRQDVIKLVKELTEAVLMCVKLELNNETGSIKEQLITSARLGLKNVIAKLKAFTEEVVEGYFVDSLTAETETLQRLLEDIEIVVVR